MGAPPTLPGVRQRGTLTTMNRWLMLLMALVISLSGRRAAACQYASCQSEGAVQLPNGADLSLPFANVEKVHVLSGYGPNAGSSLHCRASDSQCANDWYALDLNLEGYPSSGKGQPVLAAAAGTVLDAAWGSEGWANYGQRVYIEHDFGDGHKYVTMYAHLDTLKVTKGQKVAKGQQIGTLGQSCQGALSCSSFSTPHVHFAVHRDPGFGGTGSGGSYGGHAVIPEPMDGASGIQQGQTLVSKNGGTVTPPPPTCPTSIGQSETLIEEECGQLTGGALPDISGHGGHAYVTTQDNADPDYAQGIFWQLTFDQAGKYRVWAWVPALGDPSSGASYKVQHAGTSDKVLVDQSQVSDDWMELGSFDFAAGADQWVRLGDNYVNAGDNGKQIGIDALRVAPDTLPTSDAGVGGSGWGGAGTGGAISAAGAAGAVPGSGGGANAAPAGDDSGGCGCHVPGPPSPSRLSALALLAAGLLVARRRHP